MVSKSVLIAWRWYGDLTTKEYRWATKIWMESATTGSCSIPSASITWNFRNSLMTLSYQRQYTAYEEIVEIHREIERLVTTTVYQTEAITWSWRFFSAAEKVKCLFTPHRKPCTTLSTLKGVSVGLAQFRPGIIEFLVTVKEGKFYLDRWLLLRPQP